MIRDAWSWESFAQPADNIPYIVKQSKETVLLSISPLDIKIQSTESLPDHKTNRPEQIGQ